MKMAIVCHPTYGGSGVVAAELGMEIAKRGHDVHFVSHELPFRVDHTHENVFFHEVEVTSYPLFKYPPYGLALASRLLDVVRRCDVRLIHVHYAIPHAISAYLTQQMCPDCGIRTITTLHGTDITLVGSDPSFAEITSFGIANSSGVTAVSEYLAEETRRQFGVTRDLKVIPNFVDTKRYHPDRRNAQLRARYCPPDEALVVHVSNFRPVKRVADVIRIFAALTKRRAAKLLMVGSGPERALAESLAKKLGLAKQVHFVGAVPAVEELLAVCDLMLLPSESESFGLAALEAMASGVPVIGTASGGLPEVVISGESGYLAKVGDIAEQSARAAEVLCDAELHQRFRRAARARAVEQFEANQVVDVYERYYEEVMQCVK
ncbi:MAG: N-acetyl-alpha-D-glucosaminyl L-malate synthase BshA [Planctomycetota bacterium]